MTGSGAYGDRREAPVSSQLDSAMQQPASRDLHLSSSEHVSSRSNDSTASIPFTQLLSNAAAGGSDWKVRQSMTTPVKTRFST